MPELAVKPIIDILLVVEDPADEASYLVELEASGYESRVRESDFDMHRMLRTPTRDVHVHVFPTWSAEIDRYLILREHLRAIGCSRVALSSAVLGRDDATECLDELDDEQSHGGGTPGGHLRRTRG